MREIKFRAWDREEEKMNEICRLRLKLSNAQILCPESHKLEVNKIPNSNEIVLYCKKCEMFYPFPKYNDVNVGEGVK